VLGRQHDSLSGLRDRPPGFLSADRPPTSPATGSGPAVPGARECSDVLPYARRGPVTARPGGARPTASTVRHRGRSVRCGGAARWGAPVRCGRTLWTAAHGAEPAHEPEARTTRQGRALSRMFWYPVASTTRSASRRGPSLNPTPSRVNRQILFPGVPAPGGGGHGLAASSIPCRCAAARAMSW
jgi:hypothetical protein